MNETDMSIKERMDQIKKNMAFKERMDFFLSIRFISGRAG
jgi:hypothetical protein